jgi:hypothetical protein
MMWLLASAFRLGYSEGNEYSIKAMFLLNFMKYVEWPAEGNIGTFKIGVVGESEISDALIQMTAQRNNDNRKIEILKLSATNLPYCQMVFISHTENAKLDEWLKRVNGKGVLVVSEDYKINNSSASINLLNVENKIRFEINQSSLRQNNLKVSSRLTELAINVR